MGRQYQIVIHHKFMDMGHSFISLGLHRGVLCRHRYTQCLHFLGKGRLRLLWIVFRVMATGRYWLTVLLTTTIALFPSFTYVSFTTLRRNAKLMEQQHSTQSFNSIQATISKEKKQ